MNLILRILFGSAVFVGLAASVLPAQEIVASAGIELRGDWYWPYVQVLVNGKGPFTFVLDTGTNGDASVSRHLVEQLSLPRDGEELVDDTSGLNRGVVPAFRLDSLSVAGLEFKNLRADQIRGFDKEFDGILGFTLFRDYLLTLDYPNQKLTLARGSLPAADGQEILPLTLANKLPVTELTLGSKKVEVLIDSGGVGLSLPARFAEDLKFVSKPVVFARAETMSNKFEVKGAQLASDIQLGAYTFQKPFLAIDSLDPRGNLGGLLLKNFAVTFDQNNKLVQFVAKKKTIIILRPPGVPKNRDGAAKP
jgi:Aspartyl protease